MKDELIEFGFKLVGNDILYYEIEGSGGSEIWFDTVDNSFFLAGLNCANESYATPLFGISDIQDIVRLLSLITGKVEYVNPSCEK